MYCHLGAVYTFKGNYDSSLKYLNEGIVIAKSNKNKLIEANMNSLIAFSLINQGKIISSIDYYLKVLPVFEKHKMWDRVVGIYANLSEVYRKLGNNAVALDYLKNASVNSTKLTKDRYLWCVPQIFNELAYNYIDQGDLDLAIKYAKMSDSIASISYGVINKCYAKNIIAKVYLIKKDYILALKYAMEAYKQASILNDKNLYALTGIIMSDIYLAMKDYKNSEHEALKVWEADTTNIDESRNGIENIILANMYQNNISKATMYMEKYRKLNEQYTSRNLHNTILDLSFKYENNKKEARIAALERQKYLYNIIIITGSLILISFIYIIYQNKKTVKKEKQLIASKAVQDGEIRERSRLAKDLHDRLGGGLSAIKLELNNAENIHDVSRKLNNFIEEIRRITHNLMPQSLQLGLKPALEDLCKQFSNVNFHFFGNKKRISERFEFILYCCANELITNSLRYSGAKSINLQLIQDEERVSITIQDDGCGYDVNATTSGTGLKNVRDRVISCNGKINIISTPGCGTETYIEIKTDSK